MTETTKERIERQLETGWHTASTLTHYCDCSKSIAKKIIRELRQERADVRKLSVKGSRYYCIDRVIR